jgi:hypothetical protein
VTKVFKTKSGQLKIASHIRILHVEQEVHGDDTLAIESVLQCDIKRQYLLDREKELTEKLNSKLVLHFFLFKVFLAIAFVDVIANQKLNAFLASTKMMPRYRKSCLKFTLTWRPLKPIRRFQEQPKFCVVLVSVRMIKRKKQSNLKNVYF